MMRNLAIAISIVLATPANAAWSGMVYESNGLRQANLTGLGDQDREQQISLLCTSKSGIDPTYTMIVALPPTGQYSTRVGDVADVRLTLDQKSWDLQIPVDTNSSAGFAAAINSAATQEIVDILETAPSLMSVALSVGPIVEEFSINTDQLDRLATEWIDGCGRT